MIEVHVRSSRTLTASCGAVDQLTNHWHDHPSRPWGLLWTQEAKYVIQSWFHLGYVVLSALICLIDVLEAEVESSNVWCFCPVKQMDCCLSIDLIDKERYRNGIRRFYVSWRS